MKLFRQKLFSSNNENRTTFNKDLGTAGEITGAGLLVNAAGGITMNALTDNDTEKYYELSKDKRNNYDKRVKKLFDSEIPTYHDAGRSRNLFALLSDKTDHNSWTLSHKQVEDHFNKLNKKKNLTDKEKKELEKLGSIVSSEKKGIIHIGEDHLASPEVISHELGHHHFLEDKNAGKVGKISHKLYNVSRHPATIGADVGLGIASGIRAARKEEKGEKQNLGERLAWDAGTVGLQSPRLVSEAAASMYGKKLLKKHGIKGGKSLLPAFATYAGLSGAHVGLNEASRAVAKHIYKNNHGVED